MGIIYLIPVMTFTRKTWILGYVIAALLTIAVIFSNAAFIYKPAVPLKDSLGFAVMMSAGPLFTAAVAFFQSE
jgi:hypothetical protein